jgi:glycosyltransferase involved in cell wall biosynthesis
VSITYNSANVLQNFLNCVWEQEYQNLILYVIDNASNDGTLDILEKEIDSRLRIIKNDSNLGVA